MKIIDIIRDCSNIDDETKFTVSTNLDGEFSFPQYTFATCPREVLWQEIICFAFLNEEESKIFNGSAVLFSVVRKGC